jgi:hypothetical protein
MAITVVRSARPVLPFSARGATPLCVVRALAVIGVLALAAGLRLWRLDLVEFRTDEAWALRLTEDFVRLGRVPLVGLGSSVGLNNPPDFIYFLAPIMAVTRDPAVASGAVALANVAGVAGVVILGWRSFSPLAGLVAGLACATNPWAVFYGRKLWDVDLLAPLAVLLFVALERAVLANSVRWAVASLPIFAVGVEMHYPLGTLAPLMLAPMVVLLVHGHWRQLAAGVGLAGLTTVPYVVSNLQNGGADLRALQLLLARPSLYDGEGPAYVLGVATGWDNWYLLRVHLDRLVPGRLAALAANIQTALFWFGAGLALVLAFAPRGARQEVRLRHAALVFWLLLPALFTVRHAVPLYEHYFTFVPPAAALLIAAGIYWLEQRPPRWGRPLLGLALGSVLVMAAIQSFIVVRMLNRLATQDEPSYGPPLALTRSIAREVAGFGFATGSQQLAVEFWGTDSQPIAYLTRPFFPSIEVAIVGQVGLGPRLGSTPAPPESPPGQRLLGAVEQPELSYADGVKVLYAATSSHLVPSERVGLAITWVAPPPAGPIWEMSLYDAQGNQIDRRSSLQRNLASAAAGVAVTSWFTLETEPSTPPGQYELRLQRLDPGTGEPLAFVDSRGRTGTQWRSGPIDAANP